MQVQDWRAVFDRAPIYKLLGRRPPGLMVDVGAAVGMTTSWMLENSPDSRIRAFEPFPGNWAHFERTHAGDVRVTLEKRAVSDRAGVARLHVSKTINATEGRWAEYQGGSSAGKLKDDGELEVETTTLDDVLGADGRSVFAKIDVQGAELKVLTGAARALAQHRIDLLFVEYNHLPEVLTTMASHGYECVDSEYTVAPRKGADISGWEIHAERKNSMGATTLKGFPRSRPDDPEGWSQFMQDQKRAIGSVWNDLVFATPSALRDLRNQDN